MGMRAEDALAAAKSYVRKTLQGMGALKGQDGKDGKDGKSAYQTALDNGFVGTEEEWLESLKGEDGTGAIAISEKEGNIITKEDDGLYAIGGGEEPFVGEFHFKYTDDNSGFEIYNPTFTNDEVIQAVNDDRVVILKGHISTARDYAPYVFNLHRYAKNSGSYEFICHYYYTTNTIQIYNLIIRSDSVTLMQDNYDMTKQDLSDYQEKIEGAEGQFVGFDTAGKAVAMDVDLTYADFTTTNVTNLNDLQTPGIYNFSSAVTNCPTGIASKL